MDARVTLITLGVRDVARALGFYRDGLGWTPSSAGGGDFAVFQLAGGVGLALYPRHLLAADAHLPDHGGFSGITLAHNVSTREAVDATLARAVAAGARLLKPGVEAEWGGYSGYFADLDGHPWEVAWNPAWSLDGDGLLRLPA